MPNTEFLETYPLYRRFNFSTAYLGLDRTPKAPVHMECPNCESVQTFVMRNSYSEGAAFDNSPTTGAVCRLVYLCTSCQAGLRYFIVRFADDGKSVMKIGQYPPWSIDVDKDVQSFLGKHAGLFKKGLILESQGFGVGAFAYYRQITESVIDSLLDELAGLVPPADRDKYAAALAATKKTRVAQDKIDLVKDLLPDPLRPDNMNPLAVLHSALSEGLHAGSDEECATYAAEVREVLVFLVHQISVTKTSAKSFSAGIRKLLDRKSGNASQ